jgi:Methyladenine glycosylase
MYVGQHGQSAMVQYHDREWSLPVHDDTKHFEFLVLGAETLKKTVVLEPLPKPEFFGESRLNGTLANAAQGAGSSPSEHSSGYLFVPQSDHRIDFRCPSRWYVASQNRAGPQNCTHANEGQRISRRDTIKQVGH